MMRVLKLVGTVLSAIFLLSGIASAQEAIPAAQRQALIALYDSTNGDSWTNNSGWKTPPLDTDGFALPGTEGTWFGVTVDPGTLTVTAINFSGNNLVGTLPADIGSLTALKTIHLTNNQLTGSIPAELGDLTALQGLYASNNRLSGSIPPELGSLPNLGYIYLDTNDLSGPIPAELGSLPNLRQIFLYSNELSGSIPPELGNAAGMTWIVLRDNQLSGEIPAELGDLANLQVLRLGDNQLSGEIPSALGNLVHLQSLRLNNNRLSGKIPATLGNLTQLWEMLIHSNKLTGPIPTSLANLTALTATNLGYNALSTSDEALIAFLNTKDPDWAATQTIAPEGVTAASLDNAVIMVSWMPVTYTAAAGYYQVLMSQVEGGPYSPIGQTADKQTSSLNVTGLTPAQRYYFVVRTVTNPHGNNQNIVESGDSNEASAVAWTQISVQITGVVTAGGAPLAGVVMNGLTGSPVTNASGVYTGTEAAGWSGTVTPTLAGYAFVPVSRTYTAITADQTAQGYSATAVFPTITLTSPNGGEIWTAGSLHDITWTQTDMTGTVTIDLYKGGVYRKTLGTADATAGTFSWAIGATETTGPDYIVRVWQEGGLSDDSDAAIMLVRVDRTDFNCDGQEDILWRYHGSGETQGWDVAWLLHQTGTPLRGPAQPGIISMKPQADSDAVKTYMTPMGVGKSSLTAPDSSLVTPMGSGGLPMLNTRATMRDAVEFGRYLAHDTYMEIGDKRFREKASEAINKLEIEPNGVSSADLSVVNAGELELAALDAREIASLPLVIDTAWEIAGTGDLNADGKTDILWRYYGSDGIRGWNVIWYMNGTAIDHYGFLPTVEDTNWRVAGIGDFNGDGRLDVLWRYYGSGNLQGWNVIWHLDGETISGYSFPTAVSGTEWKIEGVGDFNADGKSDILWRYYDTGEHKGLNVIWYMDGEKLVDYGYPTPILELGWKADGVGDFDRDGKADILWRYYDTGVHEGLNVIWYMDDGAVVKNQEFLTQVYDTNWRIVNR